MSASTTRISNLLAANKDFAKTWETPPTMTEMRATPDHPILVLTCMDPRVVPEQFLGPSPRVAVVRNAGGRPSPDVVRSVDVLRSLVPSAEGVTVMVVHHTDCGLTLLTNSQITHDVAGRNNHSAHPKHADGQEDFGCFAAEDLESTLLLYVETLKKEERLTGVEVRGFVLEIETGILREVS